MNFRVFIPWFCRPLRTLVPHTTQAHPSLSFAFWIHFFIFSSHKSFSASSRHLSLGSSHFSCISWLSFKHFVTQPCLIHSDHVPEPVQPAPFHSRHRIKGFVQFPVSSDSPQPLSIYRSTYLPQDFNNFRLANEFSQSNALARDVSHTNETYCCNNQSRNRLGVEPTCPRWWCPETQSS